MELVIPPRDHGEFAFKYTWDENGDVSQVNRVAEPSLPGTSHRPRGRQTVQWPFQSIATVETSFLTQLTDQPFPFRPGSSPRERRATWEPKRLLLRSQASDEERVARDLVPDYVINFIRGETPETVARRKRNGGNLGERVVDVVTPRGHQPHLSRAAEFEGFFDDRSYRQDGLRSYSPGDGDEEHILPGDREKRPPRRCGWRLPMTGWRGGVVLNMLLGLLMFVVGLVCLLCASAKVSLSARESIFFTGSCARAEDVNTGVHALVSVVVVALLAGANYIFQVLSSPSRAEVDAAHARKKWLDIGIPSLRNLRHVARGRAVLALVVVLVVAVTQVIYYAVIFTSQTTLDYNILLVRPSFLKPGASFSNATSSNEAMLSRLDILSLQEMSSRNALVNITSSECLDQLGASHQSDFKALLLVTKNDSSTNSLVQTASSRSFSSVYQLVDSTPVDFCLAQPSDLERTCTVNLNGTLLGVAVLLTLITVAIAITLLFRRSFNLLVSLGDALSSFLEYPDATTFESCLMTKTDVLQQRWGLQEAKPWTPRNQFWFRAPSSSQWCLIAFLWVSATALTATGLALTLHSAPASHLSRFGRPSQYSSHALPSSLPAPAAALIASLPQLLLAALYLAANSLLTTYYLSDEFSQYALATPRALRVTFSPEGVQSTSLFLTLPRPWSWFLALLFAGLSFALSQSIFLVSIQPTPTISSANQAVPSYLAVSVNSTALLVVLILLALLAIIILALGFRRAPPVVMGTAGTNPLALEGGSCSAVIAARCHAAAAEVQEGQLWRRYVTWGVVQGAAGGTGVPHCAFTAGRAGDVELGRSYA